MFLTTVVVGSVFLLSLTSAVVLHNRDKDGRGAYWGPGWGDFAGITAVISGAFFIGLLLSQIS